MIFYFSGTGNSRHIAELLAAKEMETEGTAPNLIDMAAEMKQRKLRYSVCEGERIGFVFPVYFYGVPKVVEDFVHDFELRGIGPTNYVYTVMTCGKTTANAGGMLAKLLQEHEYNLSAQYAVSMVDNYVPMSKLAALSEQEKSIQAAEREMDTISQSIIERRLLDGNRIKGAFPGLMTALIYPLYRHGRKTSNFHVNHSCNGCGLCERNCPYGAILVEEGKLPIWDKPQCILCLRCLHQCPQGAIRYGKKSEKNGQFTYWNERKKQR